MSAPQVDLSVPGSQWLGAPEVEEIIWLDGLLDFDSGYFDAPRSLRESA